MIIAGTGHRPKWLPWKYNERDKRCIELKRQLAYQLAIHQPTYVITGMALGWDTWLADAAIINDIPFHCYIPYEGHGANSKWPEATKRRYWNIREQAQHTIITSKNYHKKCFFTRDEAMVNKADIMFALWNPEIQKGGTYYTVKYAKEKLGEDKIVNFWKYIEL